MKLISVVSRKGGAGKTTCTANIAYALAKNGLKIAVVDLDPSEDLSRRMLPTKQPEGATVSLRKARLAARGGDSLPEVLRCLDEERMDIVLIDFPGKLDESNRSVLQFLEAGDLVIVPVSESLDSLRALLAVQQVFLQSKKSDGVLFLGLKNLWPPKPTYLSNIQDELLVQHGIKTFGTPITFRKAAYLKAEGLNGYIGHSGLRAKQSMVEFEFIAEDIMKLMKFKKRVQK